MDTSRPGPLMMLGGGILMVLGPILKWGGDTSGVSTDAAGLLGIIVLLSGLFILGVGAVRAFGIEVAIPERIAGFTIEQICLIDGFAAFLWVFAFATEDGTKIGLHLTWLGAALATAGAAVAIRQTRTTPPGGVL
ncbi:MAG: hypothetical protein ACR2QE_05280 [Acidimicrobiales bacterium]